MRLFITAAAACVAFTVSAQAQMSDTKGSSGFNGSIGLGLGYAPDYEGSDDYEIIPMFFGRVTYSDTAFLDLNKQQLGAIFDLGGNMRLGPILQYRSGLKDNYNSGLSGRSDTEWTVELGGFVEYEAGDLVLGVTATQDLGIRAKTHEGFVVDIGARYRYESSPRLSGTVGISTTWASNNYMQTYFGVSNTDAASVAKRNGSAALQTPYKAESGLYRVNLNASVGYDFSDNWSMQGIAAYKRLFGGAADSPLVGGAQDNGIGAKDQFFAGAGASYRF